MKRFATFLVVACLAAVEARAHDWTHWRGPEQTGVSREKDLPDKWSPDENAPNNNLVWKQPYGCRSSPIVMNGRVFIINDADAGINEQERVVCFDAATGKVLWEKRFNVFLTDIVSSRVGWSSMSGDPETGNVYCHGVQGLLLCFDRDGEVKWSRSLTEEYGRITGYGGRVTNPIVDGDLVIVGMVNSSWGDQARGGIRFVAFDKRTGEVVWWSDTGFPIKGTFYSNPVVAVVNGLRLLISGGGDGYLHAFKVRTGEKVWSFPVGLQAVNASPVVDGTLVYVTHGEESEGTNTPGRILCVDASKVTKGQPKEVWKVDGIKAGLASPLVHDGRLYVCNDGAMMYCFDAKTGKRIWTFKYGRVARGSPVWADGKIYVCEVNARFHILKPGPRKCEELHDQFFKSPDGRSFVETNGTPSIANGRIFIGTRDWLYCIGKKDHKTPADPIPESAAEKPADPTAKATHLQVLPADTTLVPGKSAEFRARVFDANGHLLRNVKAQWSLPTPPPPPGATASPPPLQGSIDAAGKYTAALQPPGQQGFVMAKADGLSGRGRVRVVPTIPYRIDFERLPEGRTPGGWVNAQGKFAVALLKDGSKVFKKLANDSRPPLARANAYLNLPSAKNYTIQSDVLGMKVGAYLPDMGVVNSRYTLILDGNKQLLRIVSWEAQPRVDKSIPWDWKPDVWYRMKLEVTPKGELALVRGKVWPREESEPSAWSIEFEDPKPNREGAPALFGYALGILSPQVGTEILYDNVSVTPNK